MSYDDKTANLIKLKKRQTNEHFHFNFSQANMLYMSKTTNVSCTNQNIEQSYTNDSQKKTHQINEEIIQAALKANEYNKCFTHGQKSLAKLDKAFHHMKRKKEVRLFCLLMQQLYVLRPQLVNHTHNI